MPEIRQLWRRVERDCEWASRRVPTVRLFFRDKRATPAVLESLEKTRVGKMPELALLGVEEEESDFMYIYPRPPLLHEEFPIIPQFPSYLFCNI